MSEFNKKISDVKVEKTKAVVSVKTKATKKSGGGGGSGKSMKNNILDDGSLYNDPSALDERDPNYDSEEETGHEYIPAVPKSVLVYDPDLRSAVKSASMKLPDYKKVIEKVLEEYFSSGDVEEWKRCIIELQCPEYSYELVKRAVSMSLDRSDRERYVVFYII